PTPAPSAATAKRPSSACLPLRGGGGIAHVETAENNTGTSHPPSSPSPLRGGPGRGACSTLKFCCCAKTPFHQSGRLCLNFPPGGTVSGLSIKFCRAKVTFG